MANDNLCPNCGGPKMEGTDNHTFVHTNEECLSHLRDIIQKQAGKVAQLSETNKHLKGIEQDRIKDYFVYCLKSYGLKVTTSAWVEAIVDTTYEGEMLD